MAKQAFGSDNLPTDNSGSGGSGGDIVDLKARTQHHLRLLEREREMWRQYTVPHGNDPDSSVVKFIVQRPGDLLGMKGFRTSRRYAVNVWNYDTGKVEMLVAGPQIFQTFEQWGSAGVDIMASDIQIVREGTGRDTRYTVIRMDSSPFTAADINEGDLHDTSVFDRPLSDQELVATLKELEIDIDKILLPVPTLDEAKAMPIPFGKYKGTPLAEVVGEDQGYVEWFLSRCEENGDTGRDIYIAFKVVLTDGAFDPNNSDGAAEAPVAEEPKSSKPKTPKKRASEDSLDEDELREKIKEALTGPDWSDFSKVIALFEEHTEPTKHDVSKCSAEELAALWNAVR